MSDRIDRDVINALIAGHFADPFSKWLASSSSTAATILNERRSTITTSTCHWDTILNNCHH